MKFELGETIFYLMENRVHAAAVMTRAVIENASEDNACTPEQVSFYMPLGESRTAYYTCHGLVMECDAYANRVELAQSIIDDAEPS